MPHRNTVIDGNSVHFLGNAASFNDCVSDKLANVTKVDVSRHKFGERVNDGNNRLPEVAISHTRRAPERTGTSHIAALR